MEKQQLLALMAAIVYAGGDSNGNDPPSYSPEGAVAVALDILEEADERRDELLVGKARKKVGSRP